MGAGVFLLSGEELVAMHEQPYDSEDLLQTLLAKYPELIAGESIGSTLSQGWLLVKREVGVPDSATGGSRWSLDHLFIDDQAVPTLVEVKRSDDTESGARSSVRCSITPQTGSCTGLPSGSAQISRAAVRRTASIPLMSSDRASGMRLIPSGSGTTLSRTSVPVASGSCSSPTASPRNCAA